MLGDSRSLRNLSDLNSSREGVGRAEVALAGLTGDRVTLCGAAREGSAEASLAERACLVSLFAALEIVDFEEAGGDEDRLGAWDEGAGTAMGCNDRGVDEAETGTPVCERGRWSSS
jgi:hypothetical protein